MQTPSGRRFKRKLTTFLCQEMLYDYVTGRLDQERKQDVEAFLQEDKVSKETLKSIETGLEYSAHLASLTISSEVLDEVGQSENFRTAAARVASWNSWPEALRWSLSAIAISVLVAGLIAVIPWQKLPSFTQSNPAKPGEVVLADIPVAENVESSEPAADAGEESPEHETSGDEHDAPGTHEVATPPIEKPTATPMLAKPTATPMLAKPSATPMLAKPTPAPKPTQPEAPAVVAELPANDLGAESAQPGTESETPAPLSKDKKPQGFVYRAFMNLPNVETASVEIADKLTSFGAEKAGEVPLGWKRGNGSYFHFTLPGSNEEAALEMLRSYGPVRISKDPHPRVMPEGQVRFILWIEPET